MIGDTDIRNAMRSGSATIRLEGMQASVKIVGRQGCKVIEAIVQRLMDRDERVRAKALACIKALRKEQNHEGMKGILRAVVEHARLSGCRTGSQYMFARAREEEGAEDVYKIEDEYSQQNWGRKIGGGLALAIEIWGSPDDPTTMEAMAWMMRTVKTTISYTCCRNALWKKWKGHHQHQRTDR